MSHVLTRQKQAESFDRMPLLNVNGGADTPVPEYFATLSNVVSIRDPATLVKFLHGVLDDLSGRRAAGFLAQFRPFASVQDLLQLESAYQIFFRNAVRHRLTKEQIVQDLGHVDLEEKVKALIAEAVLGRLEEVSEFAARDSSRISKASLDDFDWKLQLILSSDKLIDVKKPCALVDFNIRNASGDLSSTTVQLSKEELDGVLDSFARIQSTFNKFTA